MACNVGNKDRTTRIVLGVGLLGAGAYFETWLGLIGLVPLLTGVVGWCPAYLPFGFSSCTTAPDAKTV